MLALKIGATWPQVNACPQRPEAGRVPRASEEARHCQHLDLGPLIVILDFWPSELRENKVMIFNATKVVVFLL